MKQQQALHALLTQALPLHQQGQLDEAKVLYEQVLSQDPLNFDALHLSGLLAAQIQKFELAAERFRQATQVRPQNAETHYQLGDVLQELSRWEEARSSYERAIALRPDLAQTHIHLGNVLQELKHWDETLAHYDRAIALEPDLPAAHHNRGLVLQQLQRWDEALTSHSQALALNPDHANACVNCGIVLQKLGRWSEALAKYEQVIAIRPDFAEAYINRGTVLQKLQRWDEALASYDRAITLNSDHAEVFYNRGIVLQELKRWDEALVSHERAIELLPDFANAHYNRGNVLQEMMHWDDALLSYEVAISQNPDHADAYIVRGNIYKKLHQFNLALESYKQAIRIKPDYAEAYSNCGNALVELGRLDEALVNYQQAVALKPDYANAHNNLASLLQDIKRWDEALVHHAYALSVDPEGDFLLGNLIFLRNKVCLWSFYDQDCQNLRTRLSQRQRVSQPFVAVGLFDDLALQETVSEIWVQTHHSASSPLGPIAPSNTSHPRKIRLAYYSADFHSHATAYLMAQLFECHDRDRFELYAFSFGPDSSDPMRQRLVAAFDHFIDVRSESDQAIAQRSRDLGIDIAVDLKGYTRDSRPGIFAHRCAPVQVNYLGYPGTMGAPFMDYLIADKVVIPPESQEHYSEQVVYLPHSYQVNDGQRPIAETIWRKSDLGLPEEGFVFCCFNNSYKITPSTFTSWMRILQAVPGSVLWLFGENAMAQRNLPCHAQTAGVDPRRLVFAPRIPLPEHLARYRAADLFLDSLPCNAHTTASDALWAGLPVLTQQGQAFAARVAASLLHAVGLPELIVHTAQEYEELAIALAKDSERLNHIKQKLAAQRDTAPLFNARQFTKHIEQAYQTMHERAQAGLAPQGFEVV